MKKSIGVVLAGLVILVLSLQGVNPIIWELRNIGEFLKGKFQGISVSYDGILSLSPKEEKIEGPAEEFFLSLLLDSEGIAYLGTGHAGKIYRIDKEGKSELYFKVPEMDVYCLVRDNRGNLYAGTSPNGKIYKISDREKGDVFFNPQEKYIWDLMFTNEGTLLAAVGESGGIYEIDMAGRGTQILNAEENHILCLKQGKNGDFFAGSGGKGLLYRISQGKKPSVLFESPYEEIKSIALDGRGNIFAGAGGLVTKPVKDAISPVSAKKETDVTITVTPSSTTPKQIFLIGPKQPSALYRIDSDGIAKKLWSSTEDLIYTLLWDKVKRRLIFGTGSRGRIYAIDREEKISLVLQKDSEQVYLLFPHDSKIYTLSNNPSRLSILFPQQRFSGEYLSRVYDTKIISSWGRMKWEAQMPSETLLQFQTRSGNSSEPNQTWSDWSPPYQKTQGEQILSPRARYIQFKVIFKTQSAKISPLLQKVSLFFLQTNVSPTIIGLELLPPNEVFLKPPEQAEMIWGLDVDSSEQAEIKNKIHAYMAAKKVQRKGFQTLRWEASDANGDSILYSIFIKREDEDDWRVLKEGWAEKIFAFDTISFPDGVYFMKIEVSDSPSNPLGMELKADKISRALMIDNSLPVIRNFRAVRDKNKLNVSFSAVDSFSHIREAKFLIRPNEWRTIFPVDGICDSKSENFNFTLSLPQKFDNLIAVKVWDSYGNVGIFRTTF